MHWLWIFLQFIGGKIMNGVSMEIASVTCPKVPLVEKIINFFTVGCTSPIWSARATKLDVKETGCQECMGCVEPCYGDEAKCIPGCGFVNECQISAHH
jgi:hypothetical protein